MTLAPAGTRLDLNDVLHALAAWRRDVSDRSSAERRIADMFGVSGVALAGSGTAALAMLLRAEQRRSGSADRCEVLIPAYTCYSVPAAIVRAGLKPRLCDVRLDTLGFDTEALAILDLSRTLAIVCTNLFGIPDDHERLARLAQVNGALLIDDAAQALGSTSGGRPVGSFGDAGIVSFDRGKNLSTIRGGAVLCRDAALDQALRAECASQPAPSTLESAVMAAQIVAYSILLRPAWFGLARHLPIPGLGETVYDPGFTVRSMTLPQLRLLTRLLGRFGEMTVARTARTRGLAASLGDLPQIHCPVRAAVETAVVAAPRFPVLLADARRRDEALAAINRRGLGASRYYPEALCDVPGLREALPHGNREMPNARQVARRLLTLPTHEFAPDQIGSRIRSVFEAL